MSKGIVGLTNIGNTCYGNASLQALRHQVDLTIYILQGKHIEILKRKPKSEKTELVEGYAKLVKSLWNGEGGAENTRDFWRSMIPAAMKEGFEQFRIPIPHDAHEFIVFMLDQLHEALAEEVTMTIHAPLGDTPKANDAKGALSFWKTNFENKYSPLVELLYGLQRKSVMCEGCKTENVSWETMNIHKVCVPKPTDSEALSIIDLMREECKSESIDGYDCDHCKPVRHSALIKRAYWRLGNWVIVTLKRNENNGRKINRNIDVPKTICFEDLFHTNSEETSVKASYELFATVDHHGHSGGGHYTSYSKHSVSGKWIMYDDDTGTEVPDVVINNSTYIVMYRKASDTKDQQPKGASDTKDQQPKGP
jgi:ubiquitin C-terminal hydrolase